MNLLLNKNQKRLYWARDWFITDRAADAVDGTFCEPGPGTMRTVVDTDSKLSISGGKLLLSPHSTPAAGDPGLWEDAVIARVVGKRVYGTIKVTDVTAIMEFGLDTGKTGVISADGIRITGDTLLVYDAAAALPIVYVPADATEYPICLICASGGGVHLFIKITNWLYFGKWGTDATASMYLGISNNTAIIEADNFIVPVTLKLPAPLSSDGFGGTYPTTDGLGHPEGVAGVIGSGGAGKVWVGTTWAIVGGALVNAPTAGAEKVTNGSMETGNPPSSWNVVVGVATGAADERTGGSGSQSIDIAQGVDGDLQPRVDQSIVNVVGTWYLVSAWCKNIDAIRVRVRGEYFLGHWSAATSWTRDILCYRGGATTEVVQVIVNTNGLGKHGRIDDFSVKPLVLSELCSFIAESTPDVVASANLTLTAGTQAGFVVCLDDAATPANFILVYCNGTSVLVDKCVGSTYSNILTGAVTYGAGYQLRYDINDGVIRVYYNNLLVGTATIADAGVKDNTKHGLFDTYGNSADNYHIYAKGTSGEYAQLGVV